MPRRCEPRLAAFCAAGLPEKARGLEAADRACGTSASSGVGGTPPPTSFDHAVPLSGGSGAGGGRGGGGGGGPAHGSGVVPVTEAVGSDASQLSHAAHVLVSEHQAGLPSLDTQASWSWHSIDGLLVRVLLLARSGSSTKKRRRSILDWPRASRLRRGFSAGTRRALLGRLRLGALSREKSQIFVLQSAHTVPYITTTTMPTRYGYRPSTHSSGQKAWLANHDSHLTFVSYHATHTLTHIYSITLHSTFRRSSP